MQFIHSNISFASQISILILRKYWPPSRQSKALGQEGQSLRRSSTLQLLDSGDFETGEDIFSISSISIGSTSPSYMSTMKVSNYSSSSSSDLEVLLPLFSRQRSVSISEAGFRDSLGTLNTRRRSDGSFSFASSRLSRFSYPGGLDKKVIFISYIIFLQFVCQGSGRAVMSTGLVAERKH